MDTFWQAIAAMGALLAAVFAAVSAHLSRRTIESSQKEAEGLLVTELLKGFWSQDFQEACRELHRRKKQYGDSYGSQYKMLDDKRSSLTNDESSVYHSWDSARRAVKAYFRTVHQLATGNYLTKKAACKILCPPHRCRDLLFGLVYPLEKETHRKQEMFRYFESCN